MYKSYVEGEQERLKRAMKFGVPIAAGSDMYLSMPAKTRGQASLLVYEAYQQSGMTPIEIIHAATRNAAELLGMQERIGKPKFFFFFPVPLPPPQRFLQARDPRVSL